MRRTLAAFILLLCVALATAAAADQATVLWVPDGDTVKVALGKEEVFVRVLGLDAAETGRSKSLGRNAKNHDRSEEQEAAIGEVAKAFARCVLPKDCRVRLEYDGGGPSKDKYGRLLAYIRLTDSRDFGGLMISMGMARAQRQYHYYRKLEYIELEAKAQREYRGLWVLDGP